MGRPPVARAALALALASCASAGRPPDRLAVAADLPPPARPVAGVAVVVVGEGRGAVTALVDAWRAALARRDVGALRALLAPTVGAIDAPGPRMSREGWLARSDEVFVHAARAREWLDVAPALRSYADCAAPCGVGMLGPGEWLVSWPELRVPRRPGMPSDMVLPTALRVAVVDGVARVVGMSDELVAALGPAPGRVSGAARP